MTKWATVAALEYPISINLAPESLAPAAVEDCPCALHWVYQNADKYGFDTTRLVVSGHSAGGHLALMTGMLEPSAGFDNGCQRLPQEWRTGNIPNVRVAAIANFFGTTDVVDKLQGPNTRLSTLRWFGSLPNRMELARQVSPITYVRKDLPPIISIVGDKDPITPYDQPVRLHAALTRAGAPNELVTIKGGGHGKTEPYAWNREQQLQAQEAVFKFLRKYKILPN